MELLILLISLSVFNLLLTCAGLCVGAGYLLSRKKK